MVPELLYRIIEPEAKLVVIAELVCVYLCKHGPYLIHCRFKKEFLAQDPTTLKA